MLEKIHLKQTEFTPLVYWDNTPNFLIKGILITENPLIFFEPIFIWLDELDQKTGVHLTFDFKLDYFNTTSSIFLLRMMKRLKKNKNQKIVWTLNVEDEDMLEIIEDFNIILDGGITINIQEEIIA